MPPNELGEAIFEFGDFRFEPANGRLIQAGRAVHAEPKALSVLRVLVENAGALVERDRLLDEVWGNVVVTPGTLTRLIAELRRTFADDPSEPRFIATVHTRGYRWVAPVRRPPAAQSAPSNLPERTVRLIGREADLARLAQLAQHARLVTVAGPGGVGKTQLALEHARTGANRGGVTRLWVDLSTATDAPSCGRLVATALDVREREDLALEATIATAIGERPMLLLLDNCERIAGPVAALARTLLARCPNATLLCTSQATLDLPEETIHWLAPLAVPGEDWTGAESPVDALLAVDSVRLFVERARAIVPQFAVDAGNAEAVAGICRRLDGLPLALELGAARLTTLTARQLLRAIEDRFAVLTRAGGAVDPRFRSLQHAIEWSYALLDPAERDLLERFSVLAGSFPLDAAFAVSGAAAGQQFVVLNRVQSLVQKSLLAVERGGDEARYRLLDSVRAFARARLAGGDREEDALRRHATFYAKLALAADAELLQPDQVVWFDRLISELPNLTAAFSWARSAARPADRQLAAELVIGLRFFFMHQSSYVEAMHWCRHVDELSEGLAPDVEARLCNAAALTLLHATRLEDTARAARRAIVCARAATDLREEALGLAMLGWCAGLQGEQAAAEQYTDEATQAAARAGDHWLLGLARHGRAFSALARGDLDEALAEFETIAAHFDRGGDPSRVRFISIYQTLVHYLRGETKLAHAAAARVGELNSVLRAERSYAGVSELAGYLASDRGRGDLAARLLGASARIRELYGAPLMRPWLPLHERALERVRGLLGAEAFAAAWMQGRRLSAAEAHALALECFAAG